MHKKRDIMQKLAKLRKITRKYAYIKKNAFFIRKLRLKNAKTLRNIA